MNLVWLGVGLGASCLVATAFVLLNRAARVIGQRLARRTPTRRERKPSGVPAILGVAVIGILWLTVMSLDGLSVVAWIVAIAAAISLGMAAALAAVVWFLQRLLAFGAATRDVAKATVELKARRGRLDNR